jgi:putative FmdB family regulatory protein
MPIREYICADAARACAHCRVQFEQAESIRAPVLTACPFCGAPVRRVYSAPGIGPSRSGFDQRAKSAGFHKLKRISRGEYEKQY